MMKIIDAHVHYSPQIGPEKLAGFLTETGTDGAVIQAVSHSRCITLVPGALMMKQLHPGSFYVFGSPDAAGYVLHRESLGEHFAGFAELIRRAGCDGVKLLEGKPQMRKQYRVPDFDEPVWEPFWQYAEETGLPLLFHVNDPEGFWSADASEWIKRQGWCYDESFVNNEDQYRQVLTVLERHPGLKIIFAHFFFMSAQLERLSGILDAYPGVAVDLTPGIEMYENFSADFEAASAFFEKYHDRIIYGTDVGGRCVLTNEGEPFNRDENIRRPEIVRAFLTNRGEELISADGNFIRDRQPFTMKCLGLRGERLEEILSGNFIRFAGGEPSPVDPEAVLELCAIMREEMIDLADADPAFDPDCSELDSAERFFSEIVYG